jgi:hypothetical protein
MELPSPPAFTDDGHRHVECRHMRAQGPLRSGARHASLKVRNALAHMAGVARPVAARLIG